jgi:Pyruvate/2-oxoacid:ferredoxin oxidoreductase gamma subunit
VRSAHHEQRAEGIGREGFVAEPLHGLLGLSLALPLSSFMLGALSALNVLPIDRQAFESVTIDLLPSRTMNENMRAFDRGREKVRALPRK